MSVKKELKKLNRALEESNAETAPDATDILSAPSEEEKNEFLEAIKEFYDIEGNINTKTDIGADNIKMLLKLRQYANLVSLHDKKTAKAINDMLEEYKELRVSKDRMGRKEFVKMVQAVLGSLEQDRKLTLRERIFGRKQ
ncbi:MAG: hypothetical protein QW478_08375 [Candidatus Micrarchaeaceae archaeon]